MYQLLVFIHVTSALFLGSFLVLPWIIKSMFSRSEDELLSFLPIVLGFVRAGHYALVFMLISGGWMVMGYSAFPSILWVIIAVALLFLMGAMIGMIHQTFKGILKSEQPQMNFTENQIKLKTVSWVMFITILMAVMIMTNPYLLNI